LIDLSDVQELVSLGNVMRRFNTAAKIIAERSLIVGAVARDLILHYAHGLPITRATADLDIAVAIGSWDAFRQLEKQLVADGAHRHDTIVHRFFIDDWKIDILPFGKVEDDGVIVWPDTQAEMNVAGFDEASTHALDVKLPGDVTAFVASPPALLLLKLVAWKDRHLIQPRHDALDIRTLIDSYDAEWNQDRLYEEADDLLQRFGYDNALAAAALLGRDAAEIARPATRDRIREIVEPETAGEALILTADMGRHVEDNLKLLEAFLVGFENAGL
jgi:predicted nucleotidyltransferase